MANNNPYPKGVNQSWESETEMYHTAFVNDQNV